MATNFVSRLSALFLSLLVLSCGGGGGGAGGGAPLPPGPSNLAYASINATTLRLTWIPPQGQVDGFLVERRMEGGNFQRLHSGLYPAELKYAEYYLEDQVPDLGGLTFRIGAVAGGKQMAYSNEVTWKAPVRSPLSVHAGLVNEGIQVGWSLVQTSSGSSVKLEERITSAAGNVGTWQEVGVTSGANAFLRTDPQGGAEYLYRVTLTRGSYSSEPTSSQVVGIPLLPPTDLTAVSEVEGILLHWTNQSLAGTGVVVLERTSTGTQTVATLQPEATSYHVLPALPGAHTFVIASSTYNRLFPSGDLLALSKTLPAPGTVIGSVLADAVHLSWQVPPEVPTWANIVVERSVGITGFEPLASLGPTTLDFIDRGAPLGFVKYRVGIKGGFTPTYGAELRTLVAPPEAGFLPLRTERRYLDPRITRAWGRPDGTWWFAATGEGNQPQYLFIPRGGGLDRFEVTSTNEMWFGDPLHVDSAGLPGIGYYEREFTGSLQTASPMKFAKWNGSAWERSSLANSENIQTGSGKLPAIWISGPPTAPVVFWNGDNGILQSRLIGGAWTAPERLNLGVTGSLMNVISGIDGHPFLVLYRYTGSGAETSIFHENASGSFDPLPTSPLEGSTDFSGAACEGGLALLWRKSVIEGGAVSVTYRFSRFDGVSWSTPEAFLTIPYDHFAGLLGELAAQKDGKRFAFVFQGVEHHQWLAIRQFDGTWSVSKLLPEWRNWRAVNFSQDGKIRVVIPGVEMLNSNEFEYCFYEEP